MACRVGLIAVVAVLSACTTGARESSASLGSSETNVPIVTPTNAYGPFPYSNEVQRHAFQAFLACADGQGVEYRGPYADSSGKGVLFTLAEGEKVSQAERLRVDEHCPQMIVGIFATPGSGGFDASLFERAPGSSRHAFDRTELPTSRSPNSMAMIPTATSRGSPSTGRTTLSCWRQANAPIHFTPTYSRVWADR
jgi:hypothetical protein